MFPLSHMMFPYDTLIMGRADVYEAEAIVNILQKYYNASRQAINAHKSTV
ncbi:conserved hypothetical protein [Ricinus communis]|uniref:Uncharacterized protein n=1 Tax=Ricinus communis TaxID=3988 RepID=B9S5D6_RICCO|nr:conserved hypothetical protein [Ricinus communis]